MMGFLERTVDCMKEGVVDFEGQQFIQSFLLQISILGGIFGFCLGFFTESFYNCFMTVLATSAIAAVVCIPSWPYYKRHQIAWEPHDPKRIAELYAAEGGAAAATREQGGGGPPAKKTSSAAVAPAEGANRKKKGSGAESRKRK